MGEMRADMHAWTMGWEYSMDVIGTHYTGLPREYSDYMDIGQYEYLTNTNLRFNE